MEIDAVCEAAEEGDVRAQFELGAAYWGRDDAEAVAWFRRAAAQGDTNAQAWVGYAYRTGRGVPQDATEAVAWYRSAAEQGNVSGQAGLGFAYWDGAGVPQNAAEAVAWFRRAAEQGNVSGQVGLGRAYLAGQGVPQDYIEAHAWFNLAAAKGDRSALENRDKLSQQMTRTQIGEAQRRARQWATMHAAASSPAAKRTQHWEVYTRADAISDGVLIDITKTASKYGFRTPVAITQGAWTKVVAWGADERRQSLERFPPRTRTGTAAETERLCAVLTMAGRMMRRAEAAGATDQLRLHYEAGNVGLEVLMHRGDIGEPVTTIVLKHERIPADVTLENPDLISLSMTMSGLVDTGTRWLLLPAEVVDALRLKSDELTGWELDEAVKRGDVVEQPGTTRVAGPVTVRIGDRSVETNCIVGRTGTEVLIGQTVLKQLDVVADCTRRTLTPRHPEGADHRYAIGRPRANDPRH